MANKGYAAPDLLADTEWLAEHTDDPNIRIVEIGTSPEDFAQGHIPGAALCEDWRIKSAADPTRVATPQEAKTLFESLGIGDDVMVVAYDRNRSRDAARLWWVLAYYGHNQVQLLDGGWKKWTQEGRPAETGRGAALSKAAPTFTPSERPEVLSTIETMKAAISSSDAVIWDTRTLEEYTGETDRGNKRKGHVPGARHLEWIELVNEADHTFKTADEVRDITSAAGIRPDITVHAY